MSGSEVKEMFSYLSKEGDASLQRLRGIYKSIYKQDLGQLKESIGSVSKADFQAALNLAIKQDSVEDQLLFLFYHLDRDKKGFLSPEDILNMFSVVGRKITPNDIENSFKYAKVHKNKMTFQDFKEYFHNF